MDITDLDDKVRVGVIFGEDGRLQPVWFARNGRRYAVDRVTYAWQERDGAVKIYHFAVAVGGTVFELALNASTLTWRLVRSYVA